MEIRRAAKSNLALAAICAVELILCAFIKGAFVLDDNPAILENKLLLNSLSDSILASPFRAVAVFFNWLDTQLFAFEPHGFLMTDAVLHVLTACALYLFLKEISDKKDDSISAIIAAGWFALNPLTIFSAFYISARSSILATLFTLTALAAYARYLKTRRYYLAALTLVACLLALFSKESGVAAPVLVIASSLLFDSGWKRRASIIAPAIIIIGTYAALRFSNLIFLGEPSATPPRFQYLATQMIVIPRYYLQSLWPMGISLEQGVALGSFSNPTVLLSMSMMVAIWITALWRFRSDKRIVFFLIWEPVTLAPESSVVPFADLAFIHRFYMPAAGFAALIGYGAAYIIKIWAAKENASKPIDKKTSKKKAKAVPPNTAPLKQKLIYSPVILCFVCFGLLDVSVGSNWKDKIEVAMQNVRVSPNKFRARYDLGVAFSNNLQYHYAWPHLEEAVRIGAPTDAEQANASNALGKSRFRRGDLSGAAECFIKATQLRPNWDDPFMNAGMALLNMNNPEAALPYLEGAVGRGNSSAQVMEAIRRAKNALGVSVGAGE